MKGEFNIVLIPTRIHSKRLPGKAGFKICGLTLLDYLIIAAKKAFLIDFVSVITTNRSKDIKFISEYSDRCFTYSYDGNEDDVLGRFIAAVETIELKRGRKVNNIVRLTHDCPLLAFHAGLIDEVLNDHLNNKCDFTHNKGGNPFPSGLDVEVMTKEVLLDINNFATDEEREHVTLAIKNHSDKYKIGEFSYRNNNMTENESLFDEKWSIDTYEEYQKVSDVIKMYCMKGNGIFENFRYTGKFRIK